MSRKGNSFANSILSCQSVWWLSSCIDIDDTCTYVGSLESKLNDKEKRVEDLKAKLAAKKNEIASEQKKQAERQLQLQKEKEKSQLIDNLKQAQVSLEVSRKNVLNSKKVLFRQFSDTYIQAHILSSFPLFLGPGATDSIQEDCVGWKSSS